MQKIDVKDYPKITLSVNDIKKDPSNPNTMTLEQLNGLEKSLTKFGRLKHIVVDQNNILIDGEHRLEVEKAIGTKQVEVIQVWVNDEIDRKMMRETLNQLHGEYNKEKQSSELLAIFESRRLDELSELLAQPKQDFENLITKYNPDVTFVREEDDTKLPSLYDTEAFVKQGEIWQLGRHKIMCADSTMNENLDLLMESKKADMVFTDPPYAIYGSSTGFAQMEDDAMVQPFFKQIFITIKNNLKTDGHGYVCCNWRSFPSLWNANKSAAHLSSKNLIVWHKPNARLGGMYSNSHEFIYFFANDLHDVYLTKSRGKVRTVYGETNVWVINTNTNSEREHFAVKPVELMVRAVKNSSDEHNIVLDPFLGSGSTLIAAEQTNRICYGMEIDPHYCSVIIKRWELYTGQKAIRINPNSKLGE